MKKVIYMHHEHNLVVYYKLHVDNWKWCFYNGCVM